MRMRFTQGKRLGWTGQSGQEGAMSMAKALAFIMQIFQL